MIHVVDFEKTAFSTPFRGVLAPSGPQISAESGRATHSLAPGKPGWPQRPSGHCSPAPRPTPHARTSGVRPYADLCPLATASYRPPDCQSSNEVRSRRPVVLFQYVTGRTIPSEKSIRSCPPRIRVNRTGQASSLAAGFRAPVGSAGRAGGERGACRVRSLPSAPFP